MTKSAPNLHLVLTPHRSLGPRGFALLMGTTTFLCALIGARVLLLSHKAWPVALFMCLDVLLLYWAFRANYRSARAREDIWLNAQTIAVRKRDAKGGDLQVTLNAHWARVELEDLNEYQNQLRLVSHGRRVTIGAFLAPHERVEIRDELQSALARFKSMSFNA